VEGTELHFNDRNELDYLVFRITEREGAREYQGYRAVRLLQLRYISLEARRDAGLLQKMRTVLRGLYGAQVDLVYLAAGVFKNPMLELFNAMESLRFRQRKMKLLSVLYAIYLPYEPDWWVLTVKSALNHFQLKWLNG